MRAIVGKVTRELSFTAGRCPSKDTHSFETHMLDITEEERKIWEKEERLKELLLEVLAAINQVKNSKKRRLLKMRYIQGLTWKEIAFTLDIGDRYVYDLHHDALRDFEKILEIRSIPQ